MLNGKRWRQKTVQKRPPKREEEETRLFGSLSSYSSQKDCSKPLQHSCSVLGHGLKLMERPSASHPGNESEHRNSSVRDVLLYKPDILPGPTPNI